MSVRQRDCLPFVIRGEPLELVEPQPSDARPPTHGVSAFGWSQRRTRRSAALRTKRCARSGRGDHRRLCRHPACSVACPIFPLAANIPHDVQHCSQHNPVATVGTTQRQTERCSLVADHGQSLRDQSVASRCVYASRKFPFRSEARAVDSDASLIEPMGICQMFRTDVVPLGDDVLTLLLRPPTILAIPRRLESPLRGGPVARGRSHRRMRAPAL